MISNKKTKVALFDVCHTLVNVTTINDFIDNFFLLKKYNNNLKYRKKINHFIYKVFRKLKLVKSEKYKKHLVSLLKDCHEKEIKVLGKKYIEYRLKNILKPKIIAKLRYLHKKGYNVYLVSAGLDIYLKPFAKFLNAKLICTTTERKNKIYTGKIDGLDCIGKNKAIKIKRILVKNIDWKNSISFGDHLSDKYMLSMTGHSFVINPNKELINYAKKMGWNILN